MAEVDKGVTHPSISTTWPAKENLITGLLAGEVFAAGDVVYLKSSDGKLWKATGAAENEASQALGFAAMPASQVDDAVTVIRLFSGVMIGYYPVTDGGVIDTNDLAANIKLYLSGTVAGGLADAASTGGDEAIAVTMGDGRIMVGRTAD